MDRNNYTQGSGAQIQNNVGTQPIQDQIQPMKPEEAVDWFIRKRKNDDEKAEKTVRNNQCDLNKFLRWSNEVGLTDMAELDPFTADQYCDWVKGPNHKSDNAECLAPKSVNNVIQTFRLLVEELERVNRVQPGLTNSVIIPKLDDDDAVRTDHISAETATEILQHLYKFEYSSDRHIVYHLLWRLGCRRGAIHGLDVEDWNPNNRVLELHHRPDSETPLKNQKDGGRWIYIHDDLLVESLNDYVEVTRDDVQDDYGRDPLITTQSGRRCGTSLSKLIYQATRPTHYARVDPEECPCVGPSGENSHLDKCPGFQNEDAFRCGYSISPHPMRRTAVTAMLNAENSKDDVGGRSDMTRETLDKHYNQQTTEEAMKVRRNRMDMV